MTFKQLVLLCGQDYAVQIAMILCSRGPAQLPGRRPGYTDKLLIGSYKIYLHTGEYPDGTLGEIFLDTSKDGAMLRALLNCFAISVSMGLQNGIPLQRFVEAFKGMKFEPSGHVEGHPQIHRAESIIDLIFRDLELQYLPLEDEDVPQDAEGGGGVPPEARGGRGTEEDSPAGAAPELPDDGGAL